MLKTVFEKNNSMLLKGEFIFENKKQLIEQLNTLPLIEHTIKIYNKEVTTPRKVGFFSNESIGYEYSGNILPAIKFDNYMFLQNIMDQVNDITNSDFNAILINCYRDGNDYIGAHSDDERSLGNNGVVTISLGQERKFRIRDKKTKELLVDIMVKDGDLYHMKGDFQKHFTHEIPKQMSAKGTRYSLTFRKHLE
jgi:alkylated DNA repair dioxygenase AlkB